MLGTSLSSLDDFNWKSPYPVKGRPPGKGLLIGFNRDRSEFFMDGFDIYDHTVPKKLYSGIKLYFHDPYEVISEHATVRQGKENAVMKFHIIPKISTVDDSMADIDVLEYAITINIFCS